MAQSRVFDTAQPTTSPTILPEATPEKTITFAFDPFPTYFPAIIMETQGLLLKRGYTLKLVPFLIDNGKYNFSEEERLARLKMVTGTSWRRPWRPLRVLPILRLGR
ncbi:MAG: hypothetical protein HC828_15005 [Blastochloris sp.]|nr:hypothetical protein [Blastochloris sp.]